LQANYYWIINQFVKSVVLKAHYDGEKICLDEPFNLRPNTKLLVTVITGASLEEERQAWLAASQAGLAKAYGENEPDYSDAMLRERPPGE
jgi:hypothetical protein